MTQEEIIRMAREAGVDEWEIGNLINRSESQSRHLAKYERFAALVAAHEREKQAERESVGDGICLTATRHPHNCCVLVDDVSKDSIEQVEQAEQEPVAWNNTVDEVRFKEPVIQEPVAWMDEDGWFVHDKENVDLRKGKWTPVYAAPVRTKDLTDDEWQQFFNGKGVYLQSEHAGEVARAVIAADREKNK